MTDDNPTPPPTSLDDANRHIAALLPDNNIGEITPARLRAAFVVIIAAIKEGLDK